MPTKREKDAVTGRETTGHEWDGIKELDTPLPSWWVWVFIATIIWSVGYVVFYPALPGFSDSTKGVLGWSQRAELAEELAIREAERAGIYEKIEQATLADIEGDPTLMTFALRGGAASFAENCAGCHGAGGGGLPGGYPVLADDDWLWGGDLASIDQTIRAGIRSGHEDERFSEMPGFRDLLTKDERQALTQYVLSLSGQPSSLTDQAQAQAAAAYQENCASCHGVSGNGDPDVGAPALNDSIWLYGGGADQVMSQIKAPTHGVMPAWEGRLDSTTLKMLAIYVHQLGGGT